MYVFNKITVNPQLPKRIEKIEKIANNLWWSWNTEFLSLFKQIDRDLWEIVEKNPVRFLRQVSQERLEEASKSIEFLKKYDKVVENFEAYQNSKSTWFSKNYPENKNDIIAYFSAEYGLDQILSIYSGGLGILSGDHLKSASDLGIPLVAVGLLYKNGYFHQKINGYGDQEMRISQEIVLGMAGVRLLKTLGLQPTIYHMNEGHSSFLILELIKNMMKEKEISFEMAKDIVSSKTVFTTHTPVPAGNDIFPLSLVEKYFKDYWDRFGISKEEFFKMGMEPNPKPNAGFNMGILALKVAGKKNGVSKLHGAVSRELFNDVWPEIAADESPITYVTNGIHTCSWLSPNLKELYNKYLMPYWQDHIYEDETWKKINDIPNEELWNAHKIRKQKLMEKAKQNITERLKRSGYRYEEINEITSKLNPNVLTIGFARRFATYKRATLLFRDLERITQIVNNQNRPVQILIAGKAHPADKEGQDLIKYIHEISMKPQFKGKVFLLENYNMELSRYLISGVDVWLNTPRRPMEASGTSGQKASVNGAVNFSILDGWWAEGYNQKNGWAIGTNAEYENYDIQDNCDSESIYQTLENKIVPAYYEQDEKGISAKWMEYMKNSIISTGGKYSTARMLVDYTNKLYMPLANLYHKHYENLEEVANYNNWKRELYNNWEDIVITEENNLDNITMDAGNNIEVSCKVKLPNIEPENIEAQVYYGRIRENGVVEKIAVIPMLMIDYDEEERIATYKAKIELTTGGDYGYTFRVMPKHEMLLDSENLNLVKWIVK